jgi:hypothetical protein
MPNTYVNYHMNKDENPAVIVHRIDGEIYALTISSSLVDGLTMFVTPDQAKQIARLVYDEVFATL